MRKLKPDARGSILCFVGPPGVGKTSLGRSRSRGRWAATSSGSASAACATRPRSAATAAPTSARCPGTIIRALRDAGSDNPLFMIDEIDKMGADFRGDPSSAMLEVLDPEQNAIVPRPLPRRAVRPVARSCSSARPTTLDRDPGPAARPHGDHPARRLHRGREAPDRQALPRAAPDRAQRPARSPGSRSATRRCAAVIGDYTREAGVRELEREIGTICRKVAREVAEGDGRHQPRSRPSARSAPKRVRELLGRAAGPHREPAAHRGARRRDRPGVDARRRRRPVHRGHARRPAPAS